MSRCIEIVNDDLQERATVGQGWDGFWLWTDDENTKVALNYMANRAFDTRTTIRFIDEYQLYDDNDETVYKYADPSIAEMRDWLEKEHSRSFKPKEKS